MAVMYKQTDTKFPKIQKEAKKKFRLSCVACQGQTKVIHKQSKTATMSVMGAICQNSRKQLKHFITHSTELYVKIPRSEALNSFFFNRTLLHGKDHIKHMDF